jgi:hypothetical protein
VKTVSETKMEMLADVAASFDRLVAKLDADMAQMLEEYPDLPRYIPVHGIGLINSGAGEFLAV